MQKQYIGKNVQATKQAAPFQFYGDEIPVSYKPMDAGTYSADLFSVIESPSQFSNVIMALGLMKENDCMELNISGPGGSVDAADALLHAMTKCEGHIHGIATGGVHSMMSGILLMCDSFELSQGFSSLIHAGSTGMGADFQEFKQFAQFNIDAVEKQIRRVYGEGFLSESEIDEVLNGKPIVLDADGWLKRAEQRNEWRRANAEEDFNSQPIEQQAYMLAQSQLEEGTEPTQEDLDIALEFLALPKEEPVKPTRKTSKKA